jgi:ribA/ribD-fused uncharacterized protein
MRRSVYQRILLPLLIAKLFLSFSFTKEFATSDDDAIAPIKVFYVSAACANVLGKNRPIWLFKGISTNPKSNSNYRLLTALRLLLLIAAGDIEMNPGPTEIESFPQGIPEPANAILSPYPCIKCGEETFEDCVQCDYCMRWEHNHCSKLTRSMSCQIAKYDNLIYLCDDCVSAGIMPWFRRVHHKLKERAVTLGKLLDVFDAFTDMSKTSSQQPHAEIDEVERAQPTTSNQEPIMNESVVMVSETCNESNAEPQGEPIIVKGQHDPRSNFYRFDFAFGHVKYRSLEHAYQSIKATMCGYASLAWDIKHARSPQIAKRLADKLPRIATKKLHELMFDLLKAKVTQCYSFRQSLRKTGSNSIFHSTYKNVDLYWCTGLDYRNIDGHYGEYEGLNVFGKMLEEIRDKHLLAEENYETRVRCLETENYVVVLNDGEENFIHDQDFRYRGSGYHRYNH